MAAEAYHNMFFGEGGEIDPLEALRRVNGTAEAWIITTELDAVPWVFRQASSDTFPADPLKHFAVVLLDRTSHTWFRLERTRAGVSSTRVRLPDITASSKTAGYTFEARGYHLVRFLQAEGRHKYDLSSNNCQVFAHSFWEQFVHEDVAFRAFFDWVGSMPPCEESFETAVREAARGPAAAGTVLPVTLGPTGRSLIAGPVQPPPAMSHYTTRRKVVVFGLAGAGKSSMINAITGSKLGTGDGVGGVTREYRAVERSYPTDSGDRMDLSIFDTAGLDESAEGTVDAVKAVDALVKLFRNISGGVNLLVFVMKRGRAYSKLVEYYKVFANNIAGGKVPILTVVTGCEDRPRNADLQSWLLDTDEGVTNKELLRKLDIDPVDFACASFADENSRLFDREDYDKSVTIVLEKIHKLSAGEPVILCGQSLTDTMKFVYRGVNTILSSLASLFTLSNIPALSLGVPISLVEVYRRAGCSESEAHAFASEVALGRETEDVIVHLEKFDLSDEDMTTVLMAALMTIEERRSEGENAVVPDVGTTTRAAARAASAVSAATLSVASLFGSLGS